ncbi:TlpA family protein disulfide reductase [Nocardioides sp.]|uniref:TlpA family protein disulfide reductase n=1 Tax=Nocardioides sp. TaxID=35761 RepID=UPI002B26659A|nr:redoxin domain-containing protein [Nocardioides sp.]
MRQPRRTRRTPSRGLRGAVALSAVSALVLSSCSTEPEVEGAQAAPASPAAVAADPAPAPSSAPSAGEDAPVVVPASLEFSATTVAGEAFDGASVAGRPTVFWFWAPWCATCRAQISGVDDLAEQFGDDIAVVGVGALDDPEAIAEFAGTVSDDVTLLSDPDGEVWRHFEVTAQSTYVVLDAAGEQQASGFLDPDALVSTVSSLVAG